LLLGLFLASCGGGGGGDDGGFTPERIDVTITANKASVPANLIGVGPNPNQPYTSTITARVTKSGSSLPTTITITDSSADAGLGNLFKLDDSTQGFQQIVLEGTAIGQVYFLAGSRSGTATITASAQDPSTNQTVSASVNITVVGEARPAASLAFTGPYVDAVLAGESRFGEPPLQNGSYSRVISVVATDANGNPVNPNTQINFFLIDGPITDYPNTPGRFFIAGANGNPLEGGYVFDAVGGQFITRGVRPFDRLVLDGNPRSNNPLPDNMFLTGVRTVETVSGQNSLLIQRQGRPFNSGSDNGNTVPYVIGRALNAAILSPSFTNTEGVADTVLTYPVFRLGQTAILAACTEDSSVCTVLNTCDERGTNCKSVYLGATNGTDWILKASATELQPNSTTPVRLCLQDQNLIPLPATQIRYDVGASGVAVVKINNIGGNQGTILTGADGCATAIVAVTGQPLGSADIVINFTADNVAAPVPVTIKGPGAGKLDGIATCDITPPTGNTDEGTPSSAICVVNMTLVDDNFVPQPGVLITLGQGTVPAGGSFTVEFDPAEGAYGITDDEGSVVATVGLQAGQAGGAFTITFRVLTGTASFSFTVTLEAVPEPPAEE
jgi:hypothetical protein